MSKSLTSITVDTDVLEQMRRLNVNISNLASEYFKSYINYKQEIKEEDKTKEKLLIVVSELKSKLTIYQTELDNIKKQEQRTLDAELLRKQKISTGQIKVIEQ